MSRRRNSTRENGGQAMAGAMPYMQQPGQYERIYGERGELFRAVMRTIAFCLAGDLLLLIIGAGVVVVGPQAVAMVGGTVGMAVALAGWWYERLDGVIALLLGSALAACGVALGNLTGPALWEFVEANHKYALLPFGIPWLVGILAFMAATGIAILDPNYPAPRQAIARTTSVMPWSPETQDLPEEAEYEPEPPASRGRQEPVIVVHPGKSRVTSEAETLMLDLRDFLRHGAVIGYSRRSWIQSGKPRLRLVDTANSVTRGYYEMLRNHLQRGGLLSNDGDSPTLLVSLDEALAAVRALPHPTGTAREGQKVGDVSLPPIPPAAYST